MTTLKLRKIGNSLGVILPAELLGRLRVGADDTLHVTETPNGITLTPYDPDFERQMAVARKVMRKNRNVLRELAK